MHPSALRSCAWHGCCFGAFVCAARLQMQCEANLDSTKLKIGKFREKTGITYDDVYVKRNNVFSVHIFQAVTCLMPHTR